MLNLEVIILRFLSRKLLFILIILFLTGTTVIVWAQQQQPLKSKELFLLNIPLQNITKDQSILNPVPPGGGDPTCQENQLCTSWQTIVGSTSPTIDIRKPSTFLITFTGNYDCDNCVDAFGFPFLQFKIEKSIDGGPFEVADFDGFGWATYVPNSGTNVPIQRGILVNPGKHIVRLQHRFTVDSANNPFLVAPEGRVGIGAGSLKIEVLD